MSDDLGIITVKGDFTFKVTTSDYVLTSILGREYNLPAVEHPPHDVMTALCAVVVKLHQRVELLEAKLKEAEADE